MEYPIKILVLLVVGLIVIVIALGVVSVLSGGSIDLISSVINGFQDQTGLK